MKPSKTRSGLAVLLAAGLTAGAARAEEAPATLSTAAVASEPPAAASSSTSTRVAWHGNNRNERSDDDDFGAAIVRTNLSLDGGDTRFAVRIDGEGFLRPPAGIDRSNDLRLERVALELDRERNFAGTTLRGHLAIGDFYTQLGRGLLLSLRRLDELGIDLALRGVRADLALGERFDVQLVGGTVNAVNLEHQLLAHVDDPRDRIGGARVAGRFGDVTLGAHGMALDDAAPGAERKSAGYGGSLDLLVGAAALGLEVDGQRRSNLGTDEDGFAAYAVASVPLGARWTLLLEGKHYAHFQSLTGSPLSSGEGRFVYNQAPTAERIDQELVDNTDVSGGRLRADVSLGEGGASAHGSFALFANRALAQWHSHGFAGLDLRAGHGWTLGTTAGYRREWSAEDGRLARAIAHGEIDLLGALGPRVGLHLIARHESHVEASDQTRYVFHRGGASLEANLFDRLVLGAGTDWDTQNQSPQIARHFGFGLLRWRHSDAFIAQVVAGSQRGGIRCIAGACRIQAPFAGVRADVTVVY